MLRTGKPLPGPESVVMVVPSWLTLPVPTAPQLPYGTGAVASEWPPGTKVDFFMNGAYPEPLPELPPDPLPEPPPRREPRHVPSLHERPLSQALPLQHA